MKTIEGIKVFKPFVEEGSIRFTFIGKNNVPSFIGFELPIDELSEESLIEITEKVPGPRVDTIIIQAQEHGTPYEYSYSVGKTLLTLLSEVRIALQLAIQDTCNLGLVRVFEKLQIALENAYK